MHREISAVNELVHMPLNYVVLYSEGYLKWVGAIRLGAQNTDDHKLLHNSISLIKDIQNKINTGIMQSVHSNKTTKIMIQVWILLKRKKHLA